MNGCNLIRCLFNELFVTIFLIRIFWQFYHVLRSYTYVCPLRWIRYCMDIQFIPSKRVSCVNTVCMFVCICHTYLSYIPSYQRIDTYANITYSDWNYCLWYQPGYPDKHSNKIYTRIDYSCIYSCRNCPGKFICYQLFSGI